MVFVSRTLCRSNEIHSFAFASGGSPVPSRLVVVERRRDNRQFLFVQCAMFTVFPNNWKWLAPISLT